MDTYSWQSRFAHGVTLEIKRLMFSVFERSKAKDHTHGHDTMGEAGEIWSWPLWQVSLGAWPTQNWRGELWPPGSADDILGGQDLANGFFAVVWLINACDFSHQINSAIFARVTKQLLSRCGRSTLARILYGNINCWMPINGGH